MKIVVAQPLHLFPDQRARLDRLGEVVEFETRASDAQDWLERVQGADIICSGKFGLKDTVYELANVFVSCPFVGVDWLDTERLRTRNITLANAPGCNKEAVAEWVLAMMLLLLRDLPAWIHRDQINAHEIPQPTLGLAGRKLLILGAGNVGKQVALLAEVFDMDVSFVRRSDDLLAALPNADVVVDTRSSNPSTLGSLTRAAFAAMKPGSYLVSPTSTELMDLEAFTDALTSNHLAGAAIDVGWLQVGDTSDPFYQQLKQIPNLIVTPHIAYNTERTQRVGNDMMIDNIEAWLAGKPINIVE